MPLRRYEPQLDGVRAIAISLVVAFHLGYLNGGWLGVDVFFVLSGYLITSLLLADERPPGNVLAFWGRRARRLLPAVLLLLVVLSVYALVGGPGLVPAQLRSPALATLFYVANWQEIAAGHSYFAQFTAVSPLQHTWSLAIEEQYYLIWPLLIAGILFVVGRGRWSRRVLIGATLTLAAASAVWMGVADHLYGSNRAYLGTDTRAWELLVGGAIAMIWRPGPRASRHGRLWSWLTVGGLIGLAVGVSTAGGPPQWIWDGGLVAIVVCGGLVVLGSVRAPDGLVARGLTLAPLRWLGIISYSLYLWHWPVIVLMTTDTTGLSGWPLLVARLAAMTAAACASFYLIERPLRRADWGALGRRMRIGAPGIAAVGVLATAAIILFGTVTGPVASTAAVSTTATSVAAGSQVHLDIAPATPGHPYRVWLFGDSVMQDSSLGIIAALDATGEVSVSDNSTFPGWGLSTLGNTWPSWVAQQLAQSHTQIAIGSWSWDDPEALSDPVAYRALLERFIGAMLAPGDGVSVVVLLQFPQGGPDSVTDPVVRQANWVKQTRQQDAWDAVARQAVAAFPGHAAYLTTQQLFAPHGRFLTWMQTPTHTWVRARKLDNTHMCPYGAAQFGALVTEELTPYLHLPAMKPGWEYGSWTLDPRYNDPPGACPDDQPPPGYRGVPVPRV
jgi:peptidoglycan/LPS O-acetylase OafA/YrhL